MKNQFNKRYKSFLVFSVLVFSTGCAVTMNMPANRFDSPEVSGKHGYIDLGFMGATSLTLIQDYTADPPNTTPSLSSSSVNAMIGGGFGIVDKLEADLRATWNSPTMLKLKYQIIGDSHIDSKPQNFSLSVTGGAGEMNSSGNQTNSWTNVSGTYSFTDWTADFGLIFGYRIIQPVLAYGGTFYTRNWYSGNTSQTPPTGPSNTTNFAGFVNQYGFNLGAQLDLGNLFVVMEQAFVFPTVAGVSSTGSYFAVQVGARF